MTNRRQFYTGFAVGAIAVLALGSIVLIMRRSPETLQQQVAMPAAVETASAALSPSSPELAAVERITAEQAKVLLESGQAITIDVRDVDSFRAAHIPGALQIPLSYVQGEIPYFPRDKKLITYCT